MADNTTSQYDPRHLNDVSGLVAVVTGGIYLSHETASIVTPEADR